VSRPNPIRKIMATELPSITHQRRKCFRPSDDEVIYAYNIINKYVFKGVLRRPTIVQRRMRSVWGTCFWFDEQQPSGSWCEIHLVKNWFCPQWFMNTLAHEMIHQYQWDLDRWDRIEQYGRGPFMHSGAHGPSFFEWRDQFAEYDLYLKTWFGQRRWFRHQDFKKC